MSVFGWDLPPGTTMRHIDEMYGVEPPPQPRCERCRRFLPSKPDRTVAWEDSLPCDGKTIEVRTTYSPGMVAILGEDYEGQSYEERFAPCGDCVDHAAHVEVFAAGLREFRTCRHCGHESERMG
ncbi:MAG: hypothetical protein ACOYB2_11160 [Limnohabitans sp.]